MEITNEERREVAENLRNMVDYSCRYSEQFYELLTETVMNDWDFHSFPDTAERLADLIDPTPITGETSDGYHTFNELYHHRAVLFSVIVAAFPEKAWKAKKHRDSTMYDGMFIVGIETPDGQATYHYDISPYWDMFRCKEIKFAPEWDGHTPAQAIERIGKLADLIDRPTCKMPYDESWEDECPSYYRPRRCSVCGDSFIYYKYDPLNFCPNCGAEVVE